MADTVTQVVEQREGAREENQLSQPGTEQRLRRRIRFRTRRQRYQPVHQQQGSHRQKDTGSPMSDREHVCQMWPVDL